MSGTEIKSSVPHCKCIITLQGLIFYLLGSNVATQRKISKKKGCRTFLANILLLIWVLCVTDFSVFCNAKINVTEGLCDRTRK